MLTLLMDFSGACDRSRLGQGAGAVRYLRHWIPPPGRALRAVGGGAALPAPAACTALVGPGTLADPDARTVAIPVGGVKVVSITTRMLPGLSPVPGWVGKPSRVLARAAGLVAAPAPYCTTEACTSAFAVLAVPGLNPRAASARSSWPAGPVRPEALTASTTT